MILTPLIMGGKNATNTTLDSYHYSYQEYLLKNKYFYI
jgi:hypothetical protein